jgi:hypothetical protein
VGGALRWFQRGLPSAGVPTASVDLEPEGLLSAIRDGDAGAVAVTGVRRLLATQVLMSLTGSGPAPF